MLHQSHADLLLLETEQSQMFPDDFTLKVKKACGDKQGEGSDQHISTFLNFSLNIYEHSFKLTLQYML